ncbi:DUF92 domain-containing protein [Salsuginibacillus kocurii]|uniref:DUF92 domain-containing protein n=1 Tax=Salsuginibacillus kocurii TaxID=427078 RepID=UPI00037A869F|nr:DUF92 domain-containing protein [Salsuginibacillus kocurii]
MLMLLLFIVCIIGIASYKKWLSPTGAAAAFIVGLVIALAFSWPGLIILGAFFVSSSLVSKLKKKGEEETVKDDSTRTARQVFANGGVAASAALVYIVFPDFIWFAAFIASLAAATSDTWASEFGRIFGGKPRHLLTFKLQPKGTSGAISWPGTVAALGGALFVTGTAYLIVGGENSFSLTSLVILTLSGFLGQWVDTLMGALLEVEYECSVCGIVSEDKMHCQTAGAVASGWSFINNEVVNTCCTLSGAAFAILFLL